MKSSMALLAAIPVALGVSIWLGPVLAGSNTLDDFCPGTAMQPHCASAVQLFLGSKPNDTQVIATVLSIADRAAHQRLRAAQCEDFQHGMDALAAAIKDPNSAKLVAALAAQICDGPATASAGSGAPHSLSSLLEGGTGHAGGASSGSSGQTSGGTSGGASGDNTSSGASGSSGQTSGSSSDTTSSGASGQTSGTSGQSSGTSGQSSGT